MTVFLVRHADAKSRANWPHDDELRPLTKRGLFQAESLVGLLCEHPIKRILSSPSVRCVDTVAPLAKKLGRKVEPTQELLEGADAVKAYELLRSTSRASGDTVLCTHGDLVPELLRLPGRDGLVLDDSPRWPKGSTWAIHTDGKHFTTATYLPPPE
jgi:8-oxo-dGTP diphosphatase